MFKNVIISFLLMAMLFMTETYQDYFSIALYISMVAVTFFGVCSLEYAIEKEKKKFKAWKKFKEEVNEIALNQPSKVS